MLFSFDIYWRNWFCHGPTTMNSDNIISNSDVLGCMKSECHVICGLLCFIYMYAYIYIYTHGHFECLWLLWALHILSINVYPLFQKPCSWMHLLSFMIWTMSFYEVCCFGSHECFMYWSLYMLCQKGRNKDVQSIDEQGICDNMSVMERVKKSRV